MLNIRLEYKLADMWVGVFWRNGETCMAQGAPSYALPICKLVEVWVCIVPCFPIHILWVDSRPIKESQAHFAQQAKCATEDPAYMGHGIRDPQ